MYGIWASVKHCSRLGCIPALLLAAAPLSAHPSAVEFGILSCTLSPGSGSNFTGEGRDVLCEFRVGRSGPSETYVGTLQFVGQSKELFNDGMIMLVVKAPPFTKPTPGMLEQKYSAEGSTKARAPVPLNGERNSSIVLQSIREKSDQPTLALGGPLDGVIIAVELELKASPA